MTKEQNKIVGKTYEEVCQEWRGSCERIDYKEVELKITVIPRNYLNYWRPPFEADSSRAFYIGKCTYYPKGKYNSKRKSFESIHYDKVVAKFERFVDEYCTEWQARASYHYKGYEVKINQEKDKEFYLGYVQFHKNSTFKHIADTREEIEICCKNRIDKVIYEKEKVQRKMLTPKQEKIQELEQLQARISTQLEELKRKKDTWIYKGIVLEYGIDELDEGYFVGRIKNAPKGTQEFYGRIETVIKSDLEYYIDELERQYIIFCKLTGKEP
jgi:hypothetical protein